ncbi:MAG: polysaccharide deacetylase family protein [Bacillota bacterium]
MRRSSFIGLVSVLIVFIFILGLNRVGWRLIPLPDLKKPQKLSSAFQLAGGPEKTGRGFPQREIIDLATEFPGIVFNQGSQEEKIIALTFDDGPDDDTTVQVLDVLKKHKIKATFFVIGKRIEEAKDVFQRMVDEGHVVGSHSWSHPDLVKLNEKGVEEELIRVEELVSKIAGYKMSLFRSPYGSLTRENVKQIADLGYKIIAWNVDSLDWKGLSKAEVQTNILENLRNGSIVLQHSAGGPGEDLSGSVQALPVIIDTLQKEGYKFVTVPELLGIPYQK